MLGAAIEEKNLKSVRWMKRGENEERILINDINLTGPIISRTKDEK